MIKEAFCGVLLILSCSYATADNQAIQATFSEAATGNLKAMGKMFVYDMNSESKKDWESAYQWGSAMISLGYPTNQNFNQGSLNSYFKHLLGPEKLANLQEKTEKFIDLLKSRIKEQ